MSVQLEPTSSCVMSCITSSGEVDIDDDDVHWTLRLELPPNCPTDVRARSCTDHLESQLQTAQWHHHSPFAPFVPRKGRRVAHQHVYGPVDDEWRLPWDDFASAPLWETMEIPTYSSDEESEDEDEEGETDNDNDNDDGYVDNDEVNDDDSPCASEQELRVFFNAQVEKQVAESLKLLREALPAARAVSVDEYAKMLGMLRRNIIGTTTEGLGIYAYHSTINHSSEPNAVVTGDTDVPGAHILVLALKDIAAGEEILVDYLPPTSVLQEWAIEESCAQQGMCDNGGASFRIRDEQERTAEAAAAAVIERAERERTLLSQFGIETSKLT